MRSSTSGAGQRGTGKQRAERVVVAIRLRPTAGERPPVVRHEGKSVLVREHTRFSFDYIYGPEAGQERIYRDLGAPILAHAMHGFNGTILAYGQTGSGKTYTMLGGEDATPDLLAESAGIVPRLSRELFALLDAERAASTESVGVATRSVVSCSFLEVYNEVLYDLLETGGRADSQNRQAPQLDIRESAAGGCRVHGLVEAPVGSERDILRVVSAGHRRRATGSTAMNLRSSRSHAIFSIDVLRRDADGRELRARVNLVDLAGEALYRVDP
jgi:kinesin family protein 5